MEFDNTCLHCQHYFDVNNLKTERRRKLMKHSDVDLIETIANCYQLEENLLRKYVEENEDTYVCDACFKSLKTIYNSQKKCKQLTDTLKEKVSNNFKNLTIKLEYVRGNNSVKRNRDCLTPSKTGCTPKGKKFSPPRGSTPQRQQKETAVLTPLPRTQTQSHSQNQSLVLKSRFLNFNQRALVTYIPELKDFRDLVTFHIEHQYSKASEKKSDIVPLGILEKDENITEQMIEVVQHLQQYVPKTNDGKFITILLGGDALSVERGEAASRARMDAITEEDRLEGFTWKSEDWHGHVISLQETFNLLYKGTSSGEKGTLFQLRNLFDRRGVKSQVCVNVKSLIMIH
ncbi:unnamed protein product [Mytilus coruscus]|uniref:DUF6589 domain-containing protein n=1 Tax=Mytilus coruscus TaxID=42192 RepID=A0A6J8BGJ2_MYTCO|nr:unnamed protein product [Mytilus coruscus]